MTPWAPDSVAAWITAAAAVAVAYFTWRLMANDNARMRRKPLVFETRCHPEKDNPGWQHVAVTVRNLEPVGAKVTGVSLGWRRGKLYRRPGLSGIDAVVPPSIIPADKGARAVEVQISLGPVGSEHKTFSPGATAHFDFYASQGVRADTVRFDWKWADGKRA